MTLPIIYSGIAGPLNQQEVTDTKTQSLALGASAQNLARPNQFVFFAAFDGTNNNRLDIPLSALPQDTNVAQPEAQIKMANAANPNWILSGASFHRAMLTSSPKAWGVASAAYGQGVNNVQLTVIASGLSDCGFSIVDIDPLCEVLTARLQGHAVAIDLVAVCAIPDWAGALKCNKNNAQII